MQRGNDQLNSKTKAKEAEPGRLNLTLPAELNDQLFRYIMEWSKVKGKIPPQGLKTSIGRQALREWLTKHAKDFEIEVDPQ